MKSNLTHWTEKVKNEGLDLLNRFRKEHVGHTCMTEHGVGTCLSVNLNGHCMVEIAGLGVRDCMIQEVIW